MYVSYYVDGMKRLNNNVFHPTPRDPLMLLVNPDMGPLCPPWLSDAGAARECGGDPGLAYNSSDPLFFNSDDHAQRISPVRFMKLNLNRVFPWCKAQGNCCRLPAFGAGAPTPGFCNPS
jgi:hypothetical protein